MQIYVHKVCTNVFVILNFSAAAQGHGEPHQPVILTSHTLNQVLANAAPHRTPKSQSSSPKVHITPTIRDRKSAGALLLALSTTLTLPPTFCDPCIHSSTTLQLHDPDFRRSPQAPLQHSILRIRFTIQQIFLTSSSINPTVVNHPSPTISAFASVGFPQKEKEYKLLTSSRCFSR